MRALPYKCICGEWVIAYNFFAHIQCEEEVQAAVLQKAREAAALKAAREAAALQKEQEAAALKAAKEAAALKKLKKQRWDREKWRENNRRYMREYRMRMKAKREAARQSSS